MPDLPPTQAEFRAALAAQASADGAQQVNTHPNQVSKIDRQHMALTLRKQGGSYRKIAESLRGREGIQDDYGEHHAYQDVLSEIKRLQIENREAAEDIRTLELERLDELQARYWPKAVAGDYAAFDRVLSVMDRRAKYVGAYAADQLDIQIRWELLNREQMERIAQGEDPRRIMMEVSLLPAPSQEPVEVLPNGSMAIRSAQALDVTPQENGNAE